jgi:hypothetical protein
MNAKQMQGGFKRFRARFPCTLFLGTSSKVMSAGSAAGFVLKLDLAHSDPQISWVRDA